MFLVAMAILALEIVLTRLFSYSIWYHFAYLTLNMALLGFAASGAVLYAAPKLRQRLGDLLPALACLAAAVSTVVFFLVAARHPLQPQTAFSRPLPFAGSLLLHYVGVATPFFFAGIAVAAALARYADRVSRLYFFDLAGAGLGALAALAVLEWLGAPAGVFAAAALLVLAAAAFGARRMPRAAALVAVGGVGLLVVGPGVADRVTVIPAASTYMGQVHAQPDDYEVLHTEWNAINRIDVYRNRDVSQSHAQWANDGIDDRYFGSVPPVYHLVYDAHNRSDVYRFQGDLEELDFLNHHLLKTPYLLKRQPEVLVIGSGGGIDVLNAMVNGASSVTAVELQPAVVRLLRGRFADWVGDIYGAGGGGRTKIRLVAAEGRNFVRRDPGRYDPIQFTATDTWSALNTGAYVLMESYLYTVEAISNYYDHLADDGILCILVWDLIYEDDEYQQPINSRLVLQYLDVLREKGVAEPRRHLAILGKKEWYRNRFTVPLLKKSPFTREEMEQLRRFAAERRFEVLYDPLGESPDNVLSRLVLADPSERERYAEVSPYRITPTTDDRPFFFNCYKWASLFGEDRLRWEAPVSGQAVLLILLGQSILLSVLFIAGPLVLRRRRDLEGGGVGRYFVYFASLGAGFMFFEIGFIQKFVLFLGYPAYAFSLTIASLLVFSGLGSYMTGRLTRPPEALLLRLAPLLAVLLIFYTWLLPLLIDRWIGETLAVRGALTVALQLPLGLVLGAFFPVGIHIVRRVRPALVPWAWAVNGMFSVVGSVVAILVATGWGFRVLTFLAVGIYLLGTGVLLRGSGVRLPGAAWRRSRRAVHG